jgi:hypothetical protein
VVLIGGVVLHIEQARGVVGFQKCLKNTRKYGKTAIFSMAVKT